MIAFEPIPKNSTNLPTLTTFSEILVVVSTKMYDYSFFKDPFNSKPTSGTFIDIG